MIVRTADGRAYLVEEVKHEASVFSKHDRSFRLTNDVGVQYQGNALKVRVGEPWELSGSVLWAPPESSMWYQAFRELGTPFDGRHDRSFGVHSHVGVLHSDFVVVSVEPVPTGTPGVSSKGSATSTRRELNGGSRAAEAAPLESIDTVVMRGCAARGPHECESGWICEIHPSQPFPHDDCAGPGMPCSEGA